MGLLSRYIGRGSPVGFFSGAGGGSKRDPHGLMSGIYPVGRGEPPDLSTRSLLETYETLSWVRAIAGRVSTAIAETQWTLATETSGGKAIRNVELQRANLQEREKGLELLRQKGSLREISSHPMLTALNNSNPLMTGFDIMKIIQLGLDLAGDSFLVKERNGLGTPVGFWPVPSHWVIGLPTPTLPRFFVSYNAWQGEIPDTEILWFHDPQPANPYGRGASVARALGDELETYVYSSKHAKQLFFNQARPDFLVQIEGAEQSELRRIEQNWVNKLQGYWKQHRPHFMNRKIDIHEFQSQNLDNLTLVPLSQFERDTIMQTWGVPPEILGILENANRATIDAADYFMEKHVIQPRREFLRAVLQVRLAPEYDERLIVGYKSTVSEDREHELAVMSKAPHAFQVDEWRKKAGQKPLGGDVGKSHLVPLNSYLTEDPLDLSTRPLPRGGVDEPKGGEAPPEPPPVAPPAPGPPAKPPKRVPA